MQESRWEPYLPGIEAAAVAAARTTFDDPEPGATAGGTWWSGIAGRVAAERRRACALGAQMRRSEAASAREAARTMEVVAHAAMIPAAARATLGPVRHAWPLLPGAAVIERERLGFASWNAELILGLTPAELMAEVAGRIDAEDAAFGARADQAHHAALSSLADSIVAAAEETRAYEAAQAAERADWLRFSAAVAHWEANAVPWEPLPSLGLTFLPDVPAELTAAWARLVELDAKAWSALEDAGPETRDQRLCFQDADLHSEDAWPLLPCAADCGVVLLHLTEAAQRTVGRWTPPQVGGLLSVDEAYRGALSWRYVAELLRRARACVATVERAAPQDDAARKRAQRARDREAVEAAYGGRCAACGRSRADGVREFHLDHVLGNGGGRRRAERTDALRARVLAHCRKNDGKPPAGIELLCERDHRYQTRFRAAHGAPWGDRVRIDSGESWDGATLPSHEEIAATRPRPSPLS